MGVGLDFLEIRLLKTAERAEALYRIECDESASVSSYVSAIRQELTGPFEIWRGMELVAFCPNGSAN